MTSLLPDGGPKEPIEGSGQRPCIIYVSSSVYVFLSFFMERLEAMVRRGFEVVLISPEDGPMERFEALGVEHVRIPLGRTTDVGVAAVTWLLLTTQFIERKPVLVHSQTTTVHLVTAMAARAAGVPVCVSTVHGHFQTGLEHVMPGALAAPVSWACGAYYKQLAKLVDAYIVINSHEARWAQDFVDEDKLVWLRGGVGVQLGVFGGQSGRQEARRRLRLEGRRVFGFVGRLIDHKARDVLKIADRIQRALPEATFLAVLLGQGEPELEQGLRQRVEEGRSIVVLRDRDHDEMPLVYRALDVLLLPSRREGASTVLMEAAAMRVPAVAYRIAGTQDIVDDGQTGHLVELGAVEAAATAAVELLRSPSRRREMGAAARAKAQAQFSRDAVCDEVFGLYDKLIDQKIRWQ